MEPKEDGYSLGHDGDLDKADEEEDERGTRHVGTESVVHLLGVLRGHSRVRARGTSPECSSGTPSPTHQGARSQDVEDPRTSGSLSSWKTSPNHHKVMLVGRGVELCQNRNFPQTRSP